MKMFKSLKSFMRVKSEKAFKGTCTCFNFLHYLLVLNLFNFNDGLEEISILKVFVMQCCNMFPTGPILHIKGIPP